MLRALYLVVCFLYQMSMKCSMQYSGLSKRDRLRANIGALLWLLVHSAVSVMVIVLKLPALAACTAAVGVRARVLGLVLLVVLGLEL